MPISYSAAPSSSGALASMVRVLQVRSGRNGLGQFRAKCKHRARSLRGCGPSAFPGMCVHLPETLSRPCRAAPTLLRCNCAEASANTREKAPARQTHRSKQLLRRKPPQHRSPIHLSIRQWRSRIYAPSRPQKYRRRGRFAAIGKSCDRTGWALRSKSRHLRPRQRCAARA